MPRSPGRTLFLAILGVAASQGLRAEGPIPAAQGEYLFHAAGCQGCHTPEGGPLLAGGRPLRTPFGTFYPPNITPDRETGIGAWELEDFIRAVREGTSPEGVPYYPAFPYTSYRHVRAEDAAAIFAYLKAQPPVRRENRPHELVWWARWRWSMRPWHRLFLEDEQRRPLDDPELERGRYLVDALGHCGECHTPRGSFGQLDSGRYLAGATLLPEGDTAPNLTPDRDTGLGKWSEDDIEYLLETGELPDGDYVGGPMAEVVDNVTAHLTPGDRRAIARWLRIIPAIPGDR